MSEGVTDWLKEWPRAPLERSLRQIASYPSQNQGRYSHDFIVTFDDKEGSVQWQRVVMDEKKLFTPN